MRKWLVLTVVAVALILVVPRLSANCTWEVAPANINFGTYLPLTGGPRTAAPTFTVKCPPSTSGQVQITAGTAPASFTPRTLKGPGGLTLPYNLYIDATYTAIWGNGTGGSVAPPPYVTPSGGGNRFFNGTIYALLPGGADLPPGTYTDTVIVDIFDGITRDQSAMVISTVVARECTVAAFSINFGNYDVVGANETTPLDATAPIDVRCTVGTSATVALGTGMYPNGTMRRLRGTTGVLLNYNVFTDTTRASIWNTVTLKSGTSASKNSPLTLSPGGSVLYGRVFAAQDVPAGTYTDTLQATVNY